MVLATIAGCTTSDKDSGRSAVPETMPDGRSSPDNALLIPDDALALVGLDEQNFIRDAKALGYTVRAVNRDGEDLAVAADHQPGRLNIRVDNGVVVEVFAVG